MGGRILVVLGLLSTLNLGAAADQAVRVNSQAHSAADAAPMSNQDALDSTFLTIYSGARQEYKEKTSPVIISMGGKLILVRQGKSEEHQLLSDAWQTLKTVDHVPLAIFVALQSHTDVLLDDATGASLKKLVAGVGAARPEILEAHFSIETAARQQKILDDSLKFIDCTLQAGTLSRSQLDTFASAMGPLALLNADDAEELEMNEVDRIVRQWKSEMSPEEWKNLRVIVCDGHMPRDQEREMLYFSALLGEDREGHRLIFSENGDDEQKVLDLLATHRLDEQIGISFFHDPWRMHRDLLGDGAKHWLAKHALP
jgi:hypothetical protein